MKHTEYPSECQEEIRDEYKPDSHGGVHARAGEILGHDGASVLGDDFTNRLPRKPPLENLSDVGNGRRLAKRHGADLRYVYQWKKWLIWDGRRWVIDSGAEIENRAKETARSIFHEAANATHDLQRSQLAKWALESERMKSLRAMIDAARSEPGVPIDPQQLDQDQWLLNCENGTLDLRTGELRPHSRDDLITKLCAVRYDPAAGCPNWQAFLRSTFANDPKILEYVSRMCGYWLTGDVREQILSIAWGTGSNGKTTMVRAFSKMLGLDYCITADQSILIVDDSKGSSTERMDLAGKRLAVVIETDDGQEFAEAFVKQLTGGDAIRGRRVYENTFEFDPTHKVLLVTNHLPRVKATDHSFWRRVKRIDFRVTIPDELQDRQLLEKLAAEYEGILAWAVRGCIAWQRGGLAEPDSVRKATAEYRAAEDVVGQFIHDCCIVAPDAKAKLADLRKRYAAWAAERGEREISARQFSNELQARGAESYRNNGTCMRGIGLATD